MMEVAEKISFDQYWSESRFWRKKPVMNGSMKQRFGDNIYHRAAAGGAWVQADSRHSWNDEENEVNLKRDTSYTDQVLIGSKFCYWGENAPMLPKSLAKFAIGRIGEKYDFSTKDCDRLIDWYVTRDEQGQLGDPLAWRGEKRWK